MKVALAHHIGDGIKYYQEYAAARSQSQDLGKESLVEGRESTQEKDSQLGEGGGKGMVVTREYPSSRINREREGRAHRYFRVAPGRVDWF